jgi:mRNA-degrading endonuclease toxin of MazEF toxin-antitoxin module
MYKRGEVVQAPVPFSNYTQVKGRPVLVISNTSHNSGSADVIIVKITTNLIRNGVEIDNSCFSTGGITGKSHICCESIYTLEQRTIGKSYGIISDAIMDKVIEEIEKLIK